jgi:hypothetical protein
MRQAPAGTVAPRPAAPAGAAPSAKEARLPKELTEDVEQMLRDYVSGKGSDDE